jgi:hypothetical protein
MYVWGAVKVLKSLVCAYRMRVGDGLAVCLVSEGEYCAGSVGPTYSRVRKEYNLRTLKPSE